MSRLFLVRHGNTKLNNATRFWGKTDVELSTDGIREAEKLRDRLATEKIDTIYASKLSRACVTAEFIASRHSIEVTTLAELGEIDFGQVEGLTFEEINRLHPELSEDAGRLGSYYVTVRSDTLGTRTVAYAPRDEREVQVTLEPAARLDVTVKGYAECEGKENLRCTLRPEQDDAISSAAYEVSILNQTAPDSKGKTVFKTWSATSPKKTTRKIKKIL